MALDARIHEAVTDMHAYVLALDGELQRLGHHGQLASVGDPLGRHELQRRRHEIAEELEALRTTVAALRNTIDPAEQWL